MSHVPVGINRRQTASSSHPFWWLPYREAWRRYRAGETKGFTLFANDVDAAAAIFTRNHFQGIVVLLLLE